MVQINKPITESGDRTGIRIDKAARTLLDSGATFDQVKNWVDTVYRPSPDYVYAEDINIKKYKKKK